MKGIHWARQRGQWERRGISELASQTQVLDHRVMRSSGKEKRSTSGRIGGGGKKKTFGGDTKSTRGLSYRGVEGGKESVLPRRAACPTQTTGQEPSTACRGSQEDSTPQPKTDTEVDD